MNKTKCKNFFILSLITSLVFLSFLVIKAQELPELPADVREMIPEKDLLEVFCLMTKWKTGEFFAALDALEEVLIPAVQEIQSIDINVEVPDIAGYKSQGQQKLNAICSAGSWETAQQVTQDFVNFGQTIRQELGGLNSSLGGDLKAKGDEMKVRVEGEINAWVEQEKAKIEQELKAEAEQLVSQAKANLEQEMTTKEFSTEEEAMAYAQSRVSPIKAIIESQINNLVEQKKKELETEANAKASEIIGGDAEKFKTIGEKMQGIEQQINQVMENKKQDYEQYRIQAMAKRKGLILAVLDKNIETAVNQIREKESLLKEAKLNDSSVKSAEEYIAELNQDKEILIEKIQAAIDRRDETAINLAVEEIKNKWDGIRQGLERDLAKRQSPAEICSQVVPQISQAKPQIENGIIQIETAQKEIVEKKDECDITQVPLCAEVEVVFNQLSTAKEKTKNLIDQINSAEEICAQVTEETPLDDILGPMLSLRETGPEFQKEMLALKEKWQDNRAKLEKALAKKPNVKTICAMEELRVGKIEAQRKLNDLNERLDRCEKPCVGTAEACSLQLTTCGLYRARGTQFDSAREKGEELLTKFAVIDQKCANPSSTSLTEIISLAREAKQLGEEFIDLRKEAID